MRKKGYLFILVTTILFSTMEIALKVISTDFNPIETTLSRFLVGGIVILPLAIAELRHRDIKLKDIRRKDWGMFALLGFMCVVVSMVFYQLAVNYCDASVVAVLFSSNPVFVMLFAYLLLREPITRVNIISILLDIVGIVAIINPFSTALSAAGVVLTILATLFFALYGAAGKRTCRRFGGSAVTCFSFILGSLEMLAIVGLGHIPALEGMFDTVGLSLFVNVPLLTGYTMQNILPVIYVYVGVTGIGYLCWFKAMEYTSANETSMVFFFKPVLASILAAIILGDVIPVNMFAGIVLILVGSAISLAPALYKLIVANRNKSNAEIKQKAVEAIATSAEDSVD